MSEHPLFDHALSLALKDEGMALAAEKRQELLHWVREIAVSICRQRGVVTADDVGKYVYDKHQIDIAKRLGPAMGSLFKDSRFEFTGSRVKSARKKNHAREVKVWRLK